MQITALESAINRVLLKPRKEAVHRLRTSARRVEAQLALLEELLGGERAYRRPAKALRKVSKLLQKLRRAAGRVRDLDVQRTLAKEAVKSTRSEAMRRESQTLRQELKHRREMEAELLVATLKEHALELESRLEALVQALQPVASAQVRGSNLVGMVRVWYESRRTEAEQARDPDDRMHGIRKAAKLARYMAEQAHSAPVAREFERLQESGGPWHDALTLRDVARRTLGGKSGLAKMFAGRLEKLRSDFIALLNR